MAKRLSLYHLASALLLIFFAGHTFGGVVLHSDASIQQESVLTAMRSVHFMFNGADVTYFGFYQGYGLLTSIFLLLSAFLTWQLGGSDAERQMVPIAWALFLTYIGVAWLSFKYFFAGPGTIAAAVALILGYKCLSSMRLARQSEVGVARGSHPAQSAR
jgi:hypothetical protein